MADRELAYEIVLSPEDHAPFDAQPFKVVVCASGLDTARIKAFRLLKRTYGDGTQQGNPMWWWVSEQRGVEAAALNQPERSAVARETAASETELPRPGTERKERR